MRITNAERAASRIFQNFEREATDQILIGYAKSATQDGFLNGRLKGSERSLITWEGNAADADIQNACQLLSFITSTDQKKILTGYALEAIV